MTTKPTRTAEQLLEDLAAELEIPAGRYEAAERVTAPLVGGLTVQNRSSLRSSPPFTPKARFGWVQPFDLPRTRNTMTSMSSGRSILIGCGSPSRSLGTISGVS